MSEPNQTPDPSTPQNELSIVVIGSTLVERVESFKKNRKEPVLLMEIQETIDRIEMGLSCVVILALNSEAELALNMGFLKSVNPYIRRNSIRVIVLSRIDHVKITRAFLDRGVSDFLENKTSPTTINFKISKLVTQLKGNQVKPDEESKRLKASTKVESGGAINVRSTTMVAAIAEDIWLVKGSAPKKVGVQWVVETEGPDPDSGDWQFLGMASDGRQEEWSWRPRKADGSEADKTDKPDGWKFTGNKPVFDVDSKKWRMVGVKPDLSLEQKGKKVGSKIQTDPEKGLIFAADNPVAEEKIAASRKLGEVVKSKREADAQAKINTQRLETAAAADRELKRLAARDEKDEKSSLGKSAMNSPEEEIRMGKKAGVNEASDPTDREARSKLSESEDDDVALQKFRPFDDDLGDLQREFKKASETQAAESERSSRRRTQDGEESEANLRRNGSGIGNSGDRSIQLKKSESGTGEGSSSRFGSKPNQVTEERDGDDAERARKLNTNEDDEIQTSRGAREKDAARGIQLKKSNTKEDNEIQSRQSLAQKNNRGVVQKSSKGGRESEEAAESALENASGRSTQDIQGQASRLKSQGDFQKEAEQKLAREKAGNVQDAKSSLGNSKKSGDEKISDQNSDSSTLGKRSGKTDADPSGAPANGKRRRADGSEEDPTVADWDDNRKRVNPQFKTGDAANNAELVEKAYMFRRTKGKIRSSKKDARLDRVAASEFGSEQGVWEPVGEKGWIFITPEMKSKGADLILDQNPRWYMEKKSGDQKPFYDAKTKTWLFNDGQKANKADSFQQLPKEYQDFLSRLGKNPTSLADALVENENKLKQEDLITQQTFEMFEDWASTLDAPQSSSSGAPESSGKGKSKPQSHLGFFLKLSDLVASGGSHQEVYAWITKYLWETIGADNVYLLEPAAVPATPSLARIIASTSPNMKVGTALDLSKTLFSEALKIKESKLLMVSDTKAVSIHPILRPSPASGHYGVLIIQVSKAHFPNLDKNAHFLSQLTLQLVRFMMSNEAKKLNSKSA